MVTTKHCCYGECTSDSRTIKPGKTTRFIGFGNGFPKPDKDREKCQRWVQNCGRKYFKIDNVNKDTYICSIHFVGGEGPTDEHPDPIKCGTQVTRKRRRPAERHPYQSPKQRRQDIQDAAQSLMLLTQTDANDSDITASTEVASTSHSQQIQDENMFASVGPTCTPVVQDNECQTDNPPTTQVVKLSIQNKILENTVKLSEAPFSINKPDKSKRARTPLTHHVS